MDQRHSPETVQPPSTALASRSHSATESLAPAKRQLVDPVRIDDMRGVKIRHRAILLWEPGIDDLAAETDAFKLVDSLGVGTDVD